MTFMVSELTALEILDSRARPTLAVTVRLADGATARAGVPSGASTGSREAVELRDGDKSRYRRRRGAHGGGQRQRRDRRPAPRLPLALPGGGGPGDDRPGRHAGQEQARRQRPVGVSMALARALAASAGTPLWRWLTPSGVVPSLPVPHFNVLNGGVHAPNELDFQEFMLARSVPRRWPRPCAPAPRSTRRCAGARPAASCRPGSATRAASPPRSASRKRSCSSWSRPSVTPGTGRAGRRVHRPGPGGVGVPPVRRPLPGRR